MTVQRLSARTRVQMAGKPLPVPETPPCDFEHPWLYVGAVVEHKAFGVGTVVRLDLTRDSMRTLSILFPGHGERTMVCVFAHVNLRAHRA